MAMKVHESIVYELVHNLDFRKQFLLSLNESGVEFVAEFPGEQPIPVAPQSENQSVTIINDAFHEDMDALFNELLTQPAIRRSL